jgi:hypothetical protein
MSTAWCLSVAFFAPWLVGAPVLWLARGCRPLRPTDWLWAPFLGLAAIVGPLQTLVVFADLPLARTVPGFWAATLAVWAATLAHRSGRASLRSVPWRVLGLALAVYVGQGAGVVAKGVERYRGCLESDQYHYVVLGQFVMDEPFSTGWGNLGERPWLVMPVILKPDRLGQSVAHGFFAVTARHGALDMFYPTQLLGPGLMIPAVFLLGVQCGLSRRWTTWAALTAGLAPGVELLVSLCFLSHSLCVSILIAFLAGVIRLARGGGGRPLSGVVATFVLGFAVYTEFAPLFAGTAGAALAAGVVRRHIPLSRAVGVVAALVLSLGLNPAATARARTVWERGTTVGAQMNTGHRTAVWVAAVWLHFERAGAMESRLAVTFSHAFVYGSTAAAALGAVALVGRAVRSGRRLFPALACASLLVPPIVLWATRPEAAYIVGKLVLTLTPVLVLFIACGAHAAERVCATRWGGRTIPVLAASYFVVLAVQCGLEQWTWLRGGHDVGPARTWNDPDLQQLCAELRAQESADVVIALTGDRVEGTPSVASGALCYYDRHHRIRLAAPLRIWMTDLAEYPALPRTTVENLRAGTFVVRRGSAPLGVAHEVVFENGTYQLVRITGSGVSGGG